MPSEVELIGRFIKKRNQKSDEDRAYERAQKIIQQEEYEESREFEYEPHVIDLDNIADFMRLDANHTQVLMKYGTYYIFKIRYSYFKEMKQQLTKTMITEIKYPVGYLNEEEEFNFNKE